MSPRVPVLRRVGVGVLVILLAACGSEVGSSTTASTDAKREPQWAGQFLEGDLGPDRPLAIASAGGRVVVAIVSDEGLMTGYSSDERGRFQRGEPTETGISYLGLGGIARLGDGWIAVGTGGLTDDELRFEAHAFRSVDGRRWSEVVGVSGFDGPADVAGLTAVDGGLLAVGSLRTADDPAQGGFRPIAWHSADGEHWTRVPLPTGDGTEGFVQAVAANGDRVLAVGGIDRKGVMWSSNDRGSSWTIVQHDDIPSTTVLSALAAHDDVLVVSGTTPGGDGDDEGTAILLRSTDGGRSWREASDPPPAQRGQAIPLPVFAGGGQFFTLSSSFIRAWSEPGLCYADIDLCRQDTAVALYASDDGDRWSRVDTSGIGEGEAGEIDALTATDDRVVAFRRVEKGIGTWTWPAGTPLPTEGEPLEPTTDVDLLVDGEVPEPGRRYGVPLYIHCGMEWLYVGGEPWQRDDEGPDVETGAGDAIPDHWPVAQQTIFGFATIVRDGLIEYSIADGEVIATYVPATAPPPGCE